MIRLWHRLFGCGENFETTTFYSRCKRCRRAWIHTSSGALSELEKWKAAVILDRNW